MVLVWSTIPSFSLVPIPILIVVSVRYTEEPASQTAVVGESVTFICTAIGSEPIVYTWFKDGVPLSDTDHIVGTDTARLTIQSVIASDYGSYACDVTNPVNNLISRLVIFTGTLHLCTYISHAITIAIYMHESVQNVIESVCTIQKPSVMYVHDK